MLVSKTQVKMQEKCKKNTQETTQENVSILHYALGKNASQLRFSHVLLMFACVLFVFCSRFATKPYLNANPTHNVIWP